MICEAFDRATSIEKAVGHCGRLNRVLPKRPMSQGLKPGNMLPDSIADVIKSRILSWMNCPGLAAWTQCSPSSP